MAKRGRARYASTVHSVIAALSLSLAAQTPPATVGRGHEAPTTAKSADIQVSGPGGALPPAKLGSINETSDIGLQLPPAERRMRLVVNNLAVQDALAQVAKVGELKLELDPEVKGPVSLKLEDVHWTEAFYAVLKAKKLGFMRVGDVVKVETLKDMKHRAETRPRALGSEGKNGGPPETIMLPVRFATADELLPVVRSLLSKRGTVVADKRSNALMITDSAAAQIRARFEL